MSDFFSHMGSSLRHRWMLRDVLLAVALVALLTAPVVAMRSRVRLSTPVLAVAAIAAASLLAVVINSRRKLRTPDIIAQLDITPSDRERLSCAAEFLVDPDPFKQLAVRQAEDWLNTRTQPISCRPQWRREATAAAAAIALLIAIWLLTPGWFVAGAPALPYHAVAPPPSATNPSESSIAQAQQSAAPGKSGGAGQGASQNASDHGPTQARSSSSAGAADASPGGGGGTAPPSIGQGQAQANASNGNNSSGSGPAGQQGRSSTDAVNARSNGSAQGTVNGSNQSGQLAASGPDHASQGGSSSSAPRSGQQSAGPPQSQRQPTDGKQPVSEASAMASANAAPTPGALGNSGAAAGQPKQVPGAAMLGGSSPTNDHVESKSNEARLARPTRTVRAGDSPSSDPKNFSGSAHEGHSSDDDAEDPSLGKHKSDAPADTSSLALSASETADLESLPSRRRSTVIRYFRALRGEDAPSTLPTGDAH